MDRKERNSSIAVTATVVEVTHTLVNDNAGTIKLSKNSKLEWRSSSKYLMPFWENFHSEYL